MGTMEHPTGFENVCEDEETIQNGMFACRGQCNFKSCKFDSVM